jgi:hypothetical protein
MPSLSTPSHRAKVPGPRGDTMPPKIRTAFAEINQTLIKHDLNHDQVIEVVSLILASVISQNDPHDCPMIMELLGDHVLAILHGEWRERDDPQQHPLH